MTVCPSCRARGALVKLRVGVIAPAGIHGPPEPLLWEWCPECDYARSESLQRERVARPLVFIPVKEPS